MRFAFVAAVASLLGPRGVRGQTTAVSAGDTVRIWASTPELLGGAGIGLGAAVAAGSLTRTPSDRELTVPLAFWGSFGIGAALGSLRDPHRWVTVPLPPP